MNNLEKLLIFATILTPFTLLRFGFIGFGEMAIIILFLYCLQKGYFVRISRQFVFSRFWTEFLIISFFGFVVNVFLLDQETGTVEGALFDFSAYLMLLASALLIENLYRVGMLNFNLILKNIFIISGLVYGALYVTSLFTNTLFGISLNYHQFFTPLANNLHQTAMYLAPMPFLGLYIFEKEKKVFIRIIIILLVLMFSYITVQTGSFKAYTGLILGWGTYLSFKFINIFNGKLKKAVLAILVTAITLVMFANSQIIYEQFHGIFKEEDVVDGRAILYSNAIEVGMTSPIIGLGPGPHILNHGKFWDSHETFLTVFLQSGGIGLVLFITLFFRISRMMLLKPTLLAAFIPLFIYALGGDILRRLPIWLLLMFFYYSIAAEKDNRLSEQ